jgi:hypothetical protein
MRHVKRTYIVTVLAIVVGLVGCQDGRAATKYISVEIRTNDGWHLSISPDGSAGCGFGSAFVPSSRNIPAGTFDFDSVVRELERSAMLERKSPDDASFFIVQKDSGTTRYAKYTPMRQYVQTLFDKARNAMSIAPTTTQVIYVGDTSVIEEATKPTTR